MKTTLMTLVLFLGLAVSGKSHSNVPLLANTTCTGDALAADQDFISSVNTVFALQLKIQATISNELLQRSVDGTITVAEKQELSSRLGFADYSSLQDHINGIGAAVVRLKEKYPELNDAAKATASIIASVDVLVKQGKITAVNAAAYSNNFICLRELYADIVVCYRTSVTVAALNLCIRTALAEFRICVNSKG